ncbi:MAG TPA: hypothetical protein VLI90_06200 [Tepidisphaeraceae bacterium]|nr:hypothetical protein [Tepidisphaeraceae bacterium]
MSHLDPAWLLGADIAGCIVLFFAFRALFRERRRMRQRMAEHVERLVRVEGKLDRILASRTTGG